MPDVPAALTDRAAFLLRLALTKAEAMGEESLAGLGISGREYGVLALLEKGSISAQRHLGAALGIDRTTTVAVLAGLQERGLISRTPDPANRRAYRVALTDAGEILRSRAAENLADCDDRFLEHLPPEERSHLRRLLLDLL